jgi:hypothetical protein
VGSRVGRARRARMFVVCLLGLLVAEGALANAPGFAPQKRVGYGTGDQWEPAVTADGYGHVFVLYPQYGAVADCPACPSPSLSLVVSNDDGLSFGPPHLLSPSASGQFDPQIVVDPLDRRTLYASWLQNDKRDVMVARSSDFGRSWHLVVADRAEDDADKPVLAVRGPDVYVGFNHDEKFFVAGSHDDGLTFSAIHVNPNVLPGSSLAGGATIDPSGNVYFSWTAYARHEMTRRPVDIFVSRSSDGGREWNTTLLDVSGGPPDCAAQGCEAGFLGAQIALASNAAGTVYALWNAGSRNGGPERIYFSSSTTRGASWSGRVDVSGSDPAVESCFPAIAAGAAGDVRVAWMDTRNQPLWNTFYRSSTNGGATWSAESGLSGYVTGYDYVRPAGFRFPFGDYFTIAIDAQGTIHAVWGEGRNYKTPGSIWYTRGR